MKSYNFYFRLSVPESDMAVTLTVIRDQGTFGDVSAFYYAQTLVNGATLNIDFEITPQVQYTTVLLVVIY